MVVNRMYIRRVFFGGIAACLAVSFGVQGSFADSKVKQVVFRVRTVEARSERGSEKISMVQVDKRLRDLDSQLRQLPFMHYRLLSVDEAAVPVKRRQLLKLKNGDVLQLRILYRDDERVGLWLMWQDPQGVELLNTRMHFSCTASMLAGTEGGKSGGRILAINVAR